jgi:uncharacterized linocin/CFP29 family protein
VRDEAKKQRVAASFLPLYGPLPEDQQTVPMQNLNPGEEYLEIEDFQTRRLTTLSVRVALSSQQLAQPDMSSALVAFRRAANLIARAEDYLVFTSQAGTDPNLPPQLAPCIARGGDFFPGLIDPSATTPGTPGNDTRRVEVPNDIAGPDLVARVEEAVGMLEPEGHLAPFALVLNTPLFNVAHTPNEDSLVLPADRIKPLIDGPLLRSSVLNFGNESPPPKGILLSLGDDLTDLVVGKEIHVRFLQVTADDSPRYVCRVSERFTLRIKQPRAIVQLG